MQGRLIDIPYYTSPPLLFTFRQSATVAAGSYTFLQTALTPFTPSRPIQPNVLYMFETMTFAFDIDENDYFGAIATLPQFSMYLQSDASAPNLREPVVLSKYFSKLPYKLAIIGSELLGQSSDTALQGFINNRLLGNITGVLTQTPALLGKATVTAIMIFTVQEVGDNDFITDFKDMRNKQAAYAQQTPMPPSVARGYASRGGFTCP